MSREVWRRPTAGLYGHDLAVDEAAKDPEGDAGCPFAIRLSVRRRTLWRAERNRLICSIPPHLSNLLVAVWGEH